LFQPIYHEMEMTFTTNEDVPLESCNEWLSRVFAKGMLFDEDLKKKHKENSFKLSVFDLPRPLEPTKIYYAGRAYVVRLRSFDLKFLLGIRSALVSEYCGLKVLSSHVKPMPYKYITELTTLTPVVCTISKGKCWVNDDGIIILRDRIFSNVCKKAKVVFKDFKEPAENFIKGIIQLNNVPISIKYKNTKLLGAKLRLLVNEDKHSQMLAYTIMGAGCLEKNSIGFGFCIAK
jgi:CRISPR-associated endoribonuclease Cas6